MSEMAPASAPRDSAAFVIGAIAAQVIGGLVTQMSPLMIGGFMDGLAITERDAGFIASVEFLALAATAILVAPALPHCSTRRIGLIAFACALLAQTASIFSASVGALALLRGLAGVGEGALYALSLAVVAARSRNPDKVYGYFQLVWALGSVALFSIGGQLTAGFAHRGILALIAGVTLVLAPLLLLLPGDRTEDRGPAAAAIRTSPRLGIMTLAAIVLYLTASAAIYTFSAPLGERAGLDTGAVGYALTVATLIGLAGGAAATVVNVKWGRAIPISGFCLVFGLVTLALCLWREPTAYITALVASCIVFYFSMPYLFGLAAALDRSGRWAAAAGSAYLVAFAIGPALAGMVIESAGYAGLAAVCIAATAAAWALAISVSRRLAGQAGALVSAA